MDMSESATGTGIDNAFARRCAKCKEEKPATEDFFPARSSAAGGGLRSTCLACLDVGRAAGVTDRATERASGSLAAQNLSRRATPGSPAASLNEDIHAARSGAIANATSTHSRMAISNALKNANNVVEANARLFTERLFAWALNDQHPLQSWAAKLLADRILPSGVVPAIASAEASLPTDPVLPMLGEDGKAVSGPRAPAPVYISITAASPQPAQGRVLDVTPAPYQERNE